VLNSDIKSFANSVATLRFQTRWSNIPRLPKTSVLGHTFIVGVLAYLFSVELKYCDRLVYNNFFDGLFHDLAEALTRDIITPIKYSITGLDEILKEYEKELIEKEILSLLPSFFHDEIKSYTLQEFDNMTGFGVVDSIAGYNSDEKNPKDGKLLKVCDNLSAYYEASLSIEYGIVSKNLIEAKQRLLQKYENFKYNGLDIERAFTIF
jgi:putative hydrolase of HD superfamily